MTPGQYQQAQIAAATANRIIHQLELGTITAAAAILAEQENDDLTLVAAALGAHEYIDGPLDAALLIYRLLDLADSPTN